jgi:hypothetical protein
LYFPSLLIFICSKVGATEYDLVISSDVNAHFTQWFFFRLKGMKAHHSYTFNILNMIKDHSAFGWGNRVCVCLFCLCCFATLVLTVILFQMFSKRLWEAKGISWFRAPIEKILFYRNVFSSAQAKVVKKKLKTTKKDKPTKRKNFPLHFFFFSHSYFCLAQPKRRPRSLVCFSACFASRFCLLGFMHFSSTKERPGH